MKVNHDLKEQLNKSKKADLIIKNFLKHLFALFHNVSKNMEDPQLYMHINYPNIL